MLELQDKLVVNLDHEEREDDQLLAKDGSNGKIKSLYRALTLPPVVHINRYIHIYTSVCMQYIYIHTTIASG